MSALQERFAQDAALLIQQARVFGFTVTLGEAWRTPQQAQWDADHGTGVSHSLHTDRLAIDLNFFQVGAYVTDGAKLVGLGAWWKTLSPMHRWGGDIVHPRPDGNHFSITPDGARA